MAVLFRYSMTAFELYLRFDPNVPALSAVLYVSNKMILLLQAKTIRKKGRFGPKKTRYQEKIIKS